MYAHDNDEDITRLATHVRNYWSSAELQPEHGRFDASEVEIVFLESAQVFYVGKPRATGEVNWKDFSDAEKAKFQIAIDKEMHSMIENNEAMRVLSVEESIRVEKEHPDRIIRFHIPLVRKYLDEIPDGAKDIDTWKAKAR